MSAQIWEFLGCPPLPLHAQTSPNLVDHPCLSVHVDKRLTLQLMNNSHGRVKKPNSDTACTCVFLLDNFNNSIPKDGDDHEENVTQAWLAKPKIQVFQNHYLEQEKILFFSPCSIKFYIQTYCQIIWVNLNMVAIIFQTNIVIWLTTPSSCPHLSNFAWPPPPTLCVDILYG